jgi:hypothetical protein
MSLLPAARLKRPISTLLSSAKQARPTAITTGRGTPRYTATAPRAKQPTARPIMPIFGR